MVDAYIVGAVRTATGRRKGRLSRIHPIDLGAIVVDALLERTGVSGTEIDDVIWGVVSQIGAQAGNCGRNVAMASRLPLEVPGVTVDRQCGSSLQAIQFGAQAVMSGTQDLVICGGVEAMSTVEIGSNVKDGLAHGRGIPKGERLERQYPGIQFSQFDGAELLAEKYAIDRQALDEFAYLSHLKASAATEKAYFEKEIVPVDVTLEDGRAEVHRIDEGIRFDASLEALQSLKPLREGGDNPRVGQPDQRWRCGRHGGQYRSSEKTQPAGKSQNSFHGGAGIRPGRHAGRTHTGYPQGPGKGRPEHRSSGSLRDQRGIWVRALSLGQGAGSRPGPSQRQWRGPGTGPSTGWYRCQADDHPGS